jgi:hypothetical protein
LAAEGQDPEGGMSPTAQVLARLHDQQVTEIRGAAEHLGMAIKAASIWDLVDSGLHSPAEGMAKLGLAAREYRARLAKLNAGGAR